MESDGTLEAWKDFADNPGSLTTTQLSEPKGAEQIAVSKPHQYRSSNVLVQWKSAHTG
jgi:hypothetical protein